MNFIVGLFSIAAGFIVLVNFNIAEWVLILLLGIGLFTNGSMLFLRGMIDDQLSKGLRGVYIIGGIITIPLGLIAFVVPRTIALETLVIMLAAGSLAYGFYGIIIGISYRLLPTWERVLLVILGVSLLPLAGVAIFYPGAGLVVLFYLLAAMFLIKGFDRIVMGISGFKYFETVPETIIEDETLIIKDDISETEESQSQTSS